MPELPKDFLNLGNGNLAMAIERSLIDFVKSGMPHFEEMDRLNQTLIQDLIQRTEGASFEMVMASTLKLFDVSMDKEDAVTMLAFLTARTAWAATHD